MRRAIPWILWALCAVGLGVLTWRSTRVPVLAPAISLPAMPTTGWARVTRGDTAGLVTVPVQIGARAEPFILDTGADVSVLRRASMEPLGLPEELGPALTVRGINERTLGHRVAVQALQVGTRRWSEEAFLALDAEPLLAPLGAAGILGTPFFGQDLVLLEEQTVHLVHPASPDRPDLDGLVRVPFEREGTRVPVLVDGVELEAWIDTGATRSSLSWSAAQRVGTPELSPGGVQLGADGQAFEVQEGRFGTVVLGPTAFETPILQVGHADDGVELRLGMDLLGRMDRFGLDYATAEVLVPEGFFAP
ncbi:MAG: hypothetical protein GY913_26815 [Proteobacteria bacterium]|nr:hypothetical protein [Pseudomonadota bacterium]MCP4920527.1 hypothetical protein [Pseudomonadota bacterium]